MNLYLWLTVLSGILLGLYDIAKKKSLENRSLLAVMMMYALFNFLFVIFEFNNAITIEIDYLLMLLLKSFIVFASWLLSFIAIKNLPISVITPFGTFGPMFSILLGVILLNEKLAFFQIIGLSLILISFYLIRSVAKNEIGDIFKNKYLYFMICAMILGSFSGMIDKISLKGINVGQAQFWFSAFSAILFTLTYLLFDNKEKIVNNFSLYIPIMSLFLIVSDRIYFTAMKLPNSQLSIVSPLRKISIIVSVLVGGMIFREKNLMKKMLAVVVLIIGIMVLFISTE